MNQLLQHSVACGKGKSGYIYILYTNIAIKNNNYNILPVLSFVGRSVITDIMLNK